MVQDSAGPAPSREEPHPAEALPAAAPKRPWWQVLRPSSVVVLALLVVAVALAVRLVHLQYVENDNDAIHKWEMVRKFIHGAPIGVWDHHAARFAINIPTYLVQLILGADPRGYYVLPVLMGVLQPLFVFLVGRRTLGPAAGVLAAALVIAFPEMERAASQLLPAVFSGTYLTLLLWALIRHHEQPRTGWVLLAGSFLTLLYFTHLTNMYFLPGVLVATWMTRRRLTDVFWLLLPLGVCFTIETAVYAAFTDYTLGRYSIVSATHFKGTKPPLTVDKAVSRFVDVQLPWRLALYALPMAGLGVVAFGKRSDRFAVVILISMFVMLLYPIRGSSRGIAISMHQRYMSPMIPLIMLVFAGFARACVTQWLLRQPGGSWRFRAEGRRFEPLLAGLALVVYGIVSVTSDRSRPDGSHPLWRVAYHQELFTSAWEQGIPIVVRPSDVKALNEVRWLYLEDRVVRDGRGKFDFPPVRRAGRYRFVGQGSSSVVRKRIQEGRCLIRVTREGSGLGGRYLSVVYANQGESCAKPGSTPSKPPPRRRR